jgi:hypothetical protein
LFVGGSESDYIRWGDLSYRMCFSVSVIYWQALFLIFVNKLTVLIWITFLNNTKSNGKMKSPSISLVVKHSPNKLQVRGLVMIFGKVIQNNRIKGKERKWYCYKIVEVLSGGCLPKYVFHL